MNFKTFVEKAGNFLIHRVTVIFSRKSFAGCSLHICETIQNKY